MTVLVIPLTRQHCHHSCCSFSTENNLKCFKQQTYLIMHAEIIFMHRYESKQTDNIVRLAFIMPPEYIVLLFWFCLFFF